MDLYNDAFHKAILSDEYPQATRLAEYIRDYMHPSNFIDFGCSSGLYVLEVKNKMPHISVSGYEFAIDAVNNKVCDEIIEYDLTKSLNIDKKDNTLGLCLEVLEHISEDDWEPVLENISKLSDIIIFSAAHPGQGGTGHINCRPKLDWIRRFHKLGWVVDLDHTNHTINHMVNGYHLGWFRMNAMVLVKA